MNICKPAVAFGLAVVATCAAASAAITDFNTWTLVEDPPNANLSGSVDSASQITMSADGAVPDATDIGYQSVNANTPAGSTSGFAFDPTADFAVAIDYDWSFVDTVGGSGIGFGIGEDGAGSNSAGVAIGAFDDAVGPAGGAARVNDVTISPTPLIQLFASATGSMHISYSASTGDIVVGTGTVGASAPSQSATFDGATVYDLWNADGDDDLLVVSLFLRSVGAFTPALTSGSTTAVFSDLRVISGTPVAIPEPTSLAMLAVGGLLIARRRR
ncbi:MAG: PEP-CTERM sorting domain-containing protein [Planctomycetota bacterium]